MSKASHVLLETPKSEAPSPPHAHWWMLPNYTGTPMVKGRCKLCGETREFPNYLDIEGAPQSWWLQETTKRLAKGFTL